jgi:predicted TIM-barrel fold metal-dependent hydrolase
MISADCHAASANEAGGANPRDDEFREFVAPAYRGAFDEFLKARAAHRKRLLDRMGGQLHVRAGGRNPLEAAERDGGKTWDAARRLKELEQDGVAAEVLYPNCVPFQASFNAGAESPELEWEGARAYNRWAAAVCSGNPGRQAAAAVVPIHDIDMAVAEVRGSRETGLRAVFLDPLAAGNPMYNDLRYEPLWRVCADLQMPVVFHGSPKTPFDYGPRPGSTAIFVMETEWFAHRPFWFLCYGGVFERHPDLNVVFSEQGDEWVASTLARMDLRYRDERLGTTLHDQITRTPSEYWRRQCAMTSTGSIPTGSRHAVGVRNIMWGSDYPHMEGSYPKSRQILCGSLKGVPDGEAALMIGGNVARVFGFDLAELALVAEQIGAPDLGELTG